jgi:hypothetical protein
VRGCETPQPLATARRISRNGATIAMTNGKQALGGGHRKCDRTVHTFSGTKHVAIVAPLREIFRRARCERACFGAA